MALMINCAVVDDDVNDITAYFSGHGYVTLKQGDDMIRININDIDNIRELLLRAATSCSSRVTGGSMMTECTHEYYFIGHGKPAGREEYGSYKICLNCGERFGFEPDKDRESEEDM